MALPITRLEVAKTRDRRLGVYLASDLHIGSRLTDYKRLSSDLAAAASRGDRVLILGDLFDAITPRDPRFNVTTLHKRIRQSDAVITAAVDFAEELLKPVASHIDLATYGNHETSCIRHQSVDPLAELAKRLNLRVGGYAGWVVYRLGSRTLKLAYWHGRGRGGSQRSVVDAWSKMRGTFDGADVLWTAHHHQRGAFTTYTLPASPGTHASPRPTLNVITGSYMRPYHDASPGDNYAAEGLMSPGGTGGVRMVINGSEGPLKVGVEL